MALSDGVIDEESDHAALGTAAHTLAETCLRNDVAAWEFIGQTIFGGDLTVDKDMADAVQQYLDAVNEWHPNYADGEFGVELQFHRPNLHDYFWGTSDFVFVDRANRTVHIWDYKHGAGIVVEVVDNPQLMYYAAGVIDAEEIWTEIDHVHLHVAQPRGFHWEGPIRHHVMSVEELEEWLDGKLIPAMDYAMEATETHSGEHCRFCPARSRACPSLVADMNELEEMLHKLDGTGSAAELTNAEIGRLLDLHDLSKIVAKAAEKTGYARLQQGKEIPGRKLGNARVNREWKDGAEAVIVKKFGKKKAFTEPKLKSPAQIEALPQGAAIAERWGFKPQAGLQMVKSSDARPAVNKSTKAQFKPVSKK